MTHIANDKLIVALDVESADRALDLFAQLRDTAGMFKIGMQLFTAAGPDVVRQVITRGARVFLDLKYHDIPNTVAAAGVEAARHGVSIFNVHASGGAEMMKRTVEAVAETSAREGLTKPAVIAVTVLTSLDRDALGQVGIEEQPDLLVRKLARLASVCGLDGVVASAQEIKLIRTEVDRPNFLIVTPGIRSQSATKNDQRRVLTAADAIRAGADYIVVGRPILDASNPTDAAAKVVAEIENALNES